MTVLTFPSNPLNGDTYTAPNGTLYTYDGVKWIVTTTTITGEQSVNFVKDTVAQMFEDIGLNYNTETNTVSGSANTDRLKNGAHELVLDTDGNLNVPGHILSQDELHITGGGLTGISFNRWTPSTTPGDINEIGRAHV